MIDKRVQLEKIVFTHIGKHCKWGITTYERGGEDCFYIFPCGSYYTGVIRNVCGIVPVHKRGGKTWQKREKSNHEQGYNTGHNCMALDFI